MELTKEIEQQLSAPVPPSAIKTKRQGGSDIRFTSDKWVMNRLDSVVGVGGWQEHYTITSLAKPVVVKEYKNNRTGDMVQTFSMGQIVCDLEVLGVTKSSTVDILVEPGSFGTPATNAQARAFKRAAMKFGIAAELWNKDEDVDEELDAAPVQVVKSKSASQSNQATQSRSDGPSLKQVDWLTGEQFRVPVSVVNQLTGGRGGSASAMIDALRRIKAENGKAYGQDPTPFIRKALVEVGEQRIADSLPSRQKLTVVAGPADDDEDED